MKTKKKTVGHLLMIIGVLLPAIALSLMSYKLLSERSHYEGFKDEVLNRDFSTDEFKQRISAYNERVSDTSSVLDPWGGSKYEVNYQVLDKPDGVFGYVRVPSIGVMMPIYLGATDYHLSIGAGHVDGTSLPVGGDKTRSVIAIHRGYVTGVYLYDAEQVQIGDKAYIDNGLEVLTYEMVGSEIIFPDEWEKLQVQDDGDMLTLITCEPKNPPRDRRLLLNFKRVEDPAVTVEETTATESTLEPVVTSEPEETTDFFQGEAQRRTTSQWMVLIGTGVLYVLLVLVMIRFIRYLLRK